jgi:hypothetical protein
MDQELSIRDWPCDHGSADLSSAEDEDEESQIATLAPRSQLRPAGSALTFVPYTNWDSVLSYDDIPTIRWDMKWKITLNTRKKAAETEQDIVISPRKFWKHILRTKVDGATSNKPWKREKTQVVLKVTHRGTSAIEKEYKEAMDWKFEAAKIREWSPYLNEGKKITMELTFCYEQTSEDTGRTGRGGATANQLTELAARTKGRGRGACVAEAFAFAECRMPKSCTNGSDHCMDIDGKHLRLLPHHVGQLADHLQAGKPLNDYDDVPPELCRMIQDDARQREEMQQKERDRVQSRKRKRGDSSGSSRGMTMIHCQCALSHAPSSNSPSTPRMVFPTSPVVELSLPKDEAVKEYTKWQRSRVAAEDWKQNYDRAQELTLSHGYSLNVIAVNQERMSKFLTSHGVLVGVACDYVSDVKEFAKRHAGNQSS